MATNPILGRDVYLALAAVGWADGQLTTEAADAIVRTALEEGLSFEDVAAIEEATKTPKPVGDVNRMNMSKADRLYVYAVASWIAALDGHVSENEQKALAQLADALGVPATPREHADAIMRQIAEQSDRPERFDLLALRQTLDSRLEVARKLRLAQQDQEIRDPPGDRAEAAESPATDPTSEAPHEKRKAKSKGKAKAKG
jgi:tellurite resistance protein